MCQEEIGLSLAGCSGAVFVYWLFRIGALGLIMSYKFHLPSVSPWEIVRHSPSLNGEELRSIGTVELLETIHGHS